MLVLLPSPLSNYNVLMSRRLRLFLLSLTTSALLTPTSALAQNAATLQNLDTVFGNVTSVILSLIGVSALLMLIIGGFQYLNAAGNKEGAARANRTLTYAVTGLVLAISAWMIIYLLANFLGLNLTVFSVCVTPGCS